VGQLFKGHSKLDQWFPTGVSLTLGCPKQDFRWSEMRFMRVRVCMLLDVRTEIYERL